MFRGFLSLSTGVLALLCVSGIAPVSVQAQDLYGNSYAPGSAPMSSGPGGAVVGSGGQGDGGTGYGQLGASQTAPIAPATLFGLPSENGRVEWPPRPANPAAGQRNGGLARAARACPVLRCDASRRGSGESHVHRLWPTGGARSSPTLEATRIDNARRYLHGGDPITGSR